MISSADRKKKFVITLSKNRKKPTILHMIIIPLASFLYLSQGINDVKRLSLDM